MMNVTILKGGLPDHPRYEFIDSSITDTRLMGVLGLRVHYLVYPIDPFDLDNIKDIYHFYYYDVEEIGLDYINIYELDHEQGVELATKNCFGGLGAVMRPLTEKETKYLIKHFVLETIRRKEDLPKEAKELSFLYEDAEELDKIEQRYLGEKMCACLMTDYAVVNYYLMRLFGKDYEGADLLKSDDAKSEDLEDISLKNHATFLKNSIQEVFEEDGSVLYVSESLIETDDTHYIVTSEIRLKSMKVVYAKRLSYFAITPIEASLILTRKEYCNVYKINVPLEDFDVDFTGISIGTTRTSHDMGDMFMEFKTDNNHVEKKEFRLYNDLSAVYYVSDFGELIMATYTLGEMLEAEKKILGSPLIKDISLVGRYQFPRSILYDFADSGYTSFEEFLARLSGK